jgi:hypothetical protein
VTADLVAFLNARYDEAEAAQDRRRKVKPIFGLPCPRCGRPVVGYGPAIEFEDYAAALTHDRDSLGCEVTADEWRTFADDGPAADLLVLADIAAKRRIIELAEVADDHSAMARSEFWVSGDPEWVYPGERILKCLALPYADHADYRPEWKL